MSNKSKNISDNARANILKRLRGADNHLSGLTPVRGRSADVFPPPEDLVNTFIDEFTKLSGEVKVYERVQDVADGLQSLIRERGWQHVMCRDEDLVVYLPGNLKLLEETELTSVEVALTGCEFLIARSGSIMVSAAPSSGRLLNVFPPVHIVVASVKQLVPFLDDALAGFKQKYSNNIPSQATIITGASRTADIEKTLVMGAHGPKELILLLHK
jgi:L-lactate dehydrogenase complex protein LldG